MDIEVSDVSEKKLLALPSVFADVCSVVKGAPWQKELQECV